MTYILSNLDAENMSQKSIYPLIFPIKQQARGEIIRFSEQEFRFLFIQSLLNEYENIYYSVETPTKHKYQFKDVQDLDWCINNDKSQSARIDLTLYTCKDSTYERLYNIEFKNGHKIRGLKKDIFKLISESNDGIFIIAIHNTNSKTLNKVCHKINQALDLFSCKWEEPNNYPKMIHFIICIISKKVIYYQTINEKIDRLNNDLLLDTCISCLDHPK